MLRLQRQFNETVNLGIRDGTDIIYIDMVGSSRLLHAEAKIGKRDPLHSTALGKAILLTLGMSEIDRAVPRRMVARTPYTITDREHFLDDIARSAARKYALDLEENEEFQGDSEELVDIIDSTDEAPIIRWVNSLIFQAVKERASDIHIEPGEREVVVRYRIEAHADRAEAARVEERYRRWVGR